MKLDKRKRSRAPVHFDVSIALGEAVICEKIINISMNGLLCTTNPLFRKNAPCTITLSLSEEIQITVDSEISRVGDRETAIRFLSMDDESFMHLKKLVQYHTGDADRVDRELRKRAFGQAEPRRRPHA